MLHNNILYSMPYGIQRHCSLKFREGVKLNMNAPNQDKIAIYSRKSKFTGKGESIENQIELCRQYIKLHFSNVTEGDICIYEDEGFSGGNTDRPQFKRMIAAAKQKKYSVLICYRLDRISRNIGDFAKLIEELNCLSIAFISIKEQFDTNSPIGRAMMYIASVFSQLERETTAERIRDNMQELAKTGRWLGGTTPTGYQSEPVEKVTVDGKVRKAFQLTFLPEEIKTVKLIYQKFLESNSLTKVETYLIQNNIRSKLGKDYSRFAIKNILENPVYMKADEDAYRYFFDSETELCAEKSDFSGIFGIMAYNKTLQQPGRTNRIRERSNWIVAIGRHQGILSGADWVKVQEILEQNKSKAYRKPKSNAALLSGLLRCGECGSYMRPKLTRRKNADGALIYTYLCERKEKSHGQNCTMKNADGNVLDKGVCAEIGALDEDGSTLLQQLHAYSQNFDGDYSKYDTEVEQLDKSIQENEKEINNLVSALSKTEVSPACEDITKRINELHMKNDTLHARAEDLRTRIEVHFLPRDQIEIIRVILQSFASVWETMTAGEKRDALRTLVDKVVWDGETAQVYLFGSGAENETSPFVLSSLNNPYSIIPLCEDSK